jgi:hypothetical protein
VTSTHSEEPDPRYVTRETFQTEARAYAKFAALIPSLERQHFKLFGESAQAPNWEQLIEKTVAARGTLTLTQVYEQEYKVPEKREEVRNSEVESRIATKVKEAVDQERARILADNPTLADRNNARSGEREGSPVLALASKQAAEAAKTGVKLASLPSPVSAAVAAFNSGKYKAGEKAA